jgi:hypothetical protein
MPRYSILPDIGAIFWFPDNPKFNQWQTLQSLHDYGIKTEYLMNGDQTLTSVLINWSSNPDLFAFYIHRDGNSFHTTAAFEQLKSFMPNIHMRGGSLMIEDASDHIVFLMLLGTIIKC